MADFDLFASQLLEEAKRFLEKALESTNEPSKAANLHAALMLSFSSLEAHVNAIADEFASAGDLSVHERGLMLERDVRLENGRFELQTGLKMSRLDERIEFIHLKFSGKEVDRTSSWWAQLKAATELRNQLIHARSVPAINENSVRSAIQAIVSALDALYAAIYKRSFPPAGLALQSRLTF